MDRPVLITGCARSGTSMVAGIIGSGGAFGGKMSGPTQYNKKGMFENTAVRETMVKPYLDHIGADTLGQFPLPDSDNIIIDLTWKQRFLQIMESEGYKDGPLFYKGAKMCLMWPVWHYAFPKARWVIVRRFDSQIIQSCLRTPFMKAYKDETGWQSWVDYHKARFEEMTAMGLNVTEIWSNDIIKGDYAPIQKFMEDYKLTFDPEYVDLFVDKSLGKWG